MKKMKKLLIFTAASLSLSMIFGAGWAANAEKANVRPTYIDVDAKREKDEEPNVGNDGADKCEKWEFRLNLPYQHKKYPLPHRPKNTATLINGN